MHKALGSTRGLAARLPRLPAGAPKPPAGESDGAADTTAAAAGAGGVASGSGVGATAGSSTKKKLAQCKVQTSVIETHAKDACVRLQFHPMHPWILRVSAHQLCCLSFAHTDRIVFAWDVAEELLDGCFFDGDVLEAYSLLPPALVGDCSLSVVVGVASTGLVVFDTLSATRLANEPLYAGSHLSGPCLPLSCIHVLAGTSTGSILSIDVRTGSSTSFTGASKIHHAPITAIVAVSGRPSTQLHRARIVSSCAKGIVAMWDVLCATPLAQIGVTVLSSLNTRVSELRYDSILISLVAATQGGIIKTWQGQDLAPVIETTPSKGFGPLAQSTRGLPGLAVDGVLTCLDNQLILRTPSGEGSCLIHEGATSYFTQHPWQIDCFAVASSSHTGPVTLVRVAGLVPGACLGGDRALFLHGLAIMCITAATTGKPSAARLLLTLPSRLTGTGSARLTLRGDMLLVSWPNAYVLVDVSGSARILDASSGSAHWLSGASCFLVHDGKSLVTKSVSPLERKGPGVRAEVLAQVLSVSPKDLLLGSLLDKDSCRLFKADACTPVGPAFPTPSVHAWNGTGKLLALHYPGACHVLDCVDLRLLARVHLGVEPVQSLCFHLDITLLAATHNQIRLAFLSPGTVDSYVLADRGNRGVPGFVPTIDRGRRASLHVSRPDQEQNHEDAAFSPSPSLVRVWDALVESHQAVPPPVCRQSTASLALLGVVDTRLFFIADGKLDKVPLEHPLLLVGLLACARFPYRALDWTPALHSGAARDRAVVLLERLGYFEAAALVPGASPLLVLDVCIKHDLADLARRIFATKDSEMLEELVHSANSTEVEPGLRGVPRLALLLLQNGMTAALGELLGSLKGDDFRFVSALLSRPATEHPAAYSNPSSPLDVLLARLAMAGQAEVE